MSATAIHGDGEPRSVSRLALAMPDDWTHLDMGDAGFGLAQVDKLSNELTATLETAKSQGAVLGGLWAHEVDGQRASASMMAAVVPAPERSVVGEDGAVDLERAARALSPSAGSGLVGELVELPAGPAFRVHREEIARALGRTQRAVVIQYYVGVPGQSLLAILTFSTPNHELLEQLMGLFEAMAETLRWRT